jgi:hypothetical protein
VDKIFTLSRSELSLDILPQLEFLPETTIFPHKKEKNGE